MARDPILALARSALGFRRLRPGQREAVKALLAGRDVLAVLPTGSGKSAIYQLAALQIPGPTLVVSPLVALQRDQVEAIARRHLAGAGQANTAVPAGERRQAIEDFSQGDLEFLFLAPEQLANPTPSGMSWPPSRRCWWWTRPTASAPGATTSGPSTRGWGTCGRRSGARRRWPSPPPPPHRSAARSSRASGCATRPWSSAASTGPTSTWPSSGSPTPTPRTPP
jgi:hypothetical protein